MKQAIIVLLVTFLGIAAAQPFRAVCTAPVSPPAVDNETPHDADNITCEDGPARKIHTIRNYFFWPPIYKGTCDDLDCDDPPCIARKMAWKTACVLVYWIKGGWWKRIGFRRVRYLDHVSCSCKQCSDITNYRTCIKTQPCPNNDDEDSFCYYNKTRCDCCEPKDCPKGQTFDRRTCSCVCPRGSKKVGDRCIGNCKFISHSSCKHIYCEDNPHLFCEVDKYRRCSCPSCDDANASQCPRTKCLELSGNPKCIYDTRAKKCRCPECEDYTSTGTCLNSPCYGYYTCKWDNYRRKCFCPHRYGK